MRLTAEEILKVKTKGTLNIIPDSPLHRAVISAMEYYKNQEAEIQKAKYTKFLFPSDREIMELKPVHDNWSDVDKWNAVGWRTGAREMRNIILYRLNKDE